MIKKAAILAAGEGSRIKSISEFKPIVKINGIPLLELTFTNLNFNNFKKTYIIFNEDEKKMDLSKLDCLKSKKTNYFFKNTESSLHSLFEINKKLKISSLEHYFVSMVDSIVRPEDGVKFYEFCKTLKPDESAILVTSFIEDEAPLTLKINSHGYVTEFQCPIEEGTLITSGVYCLSGNLTSLLKKLIENNQKKMRTFLTEAILQKFKIKAFCIKKTLDIDRPEDIYSAEIFLKGI